MAATETVRIDGLHFLDADRVAHMAGVEVCTGDNQPLGEIDGFLIDRYTQRVKYFVVEPAAINERCLVAADKPAVLDVEERKLRVEAEPNEVEHLTAQSRRPSDDELIEAISRRSAA